METRTRAASNPRLTSPFTPLQCYTAEYKHNPSKSTHNHTRKIPISLNLYFSSNKGLHLSNKMHFTQNYNSPKWHRSSPRTASSFPKDGIQQTTYMHWISACQVLSKNFTQAKDPLSQDPYNNPSRLAALYVTPHHIGTQILPPRSLHSILTPRIAPSHAHASISSFLPPRFHKPRQGTKAPALL